MISDWALVLEGGGMRGVFTSDTLSLHDALPIRSEERPCRERV